MPVIIGASVAAGGIGAYYGQPYAGEDSDIVIIIVTVFSVFAGFLIATISIIGDPRMIHEGSWRVAEAGREEIQRRLSWHIALLFIYLLTIAFLFIGVVIRKICPPDNTLREIIEGIYFFLGITGFLLTFALPLELRKMQQEMYDAEIDRRRRSEGIHH